MPVQATANGSPDVNGKEHIVMTPEPKAAPDTRLPTGSSWREIVMSGADSGQIEGFALEHLIDLQRDPKNVSGRGR